MSLSVEVVPVETLREDARNARRHGDRNLQAIAESLRRFGQRRPLVVMPDGTVLAGNGTLRAAATLLGWTEIAVTRVPADWTEAEARAFALADNRTAELADWDDVVLFETLDELQADGWTLEDLGFGPDARSEPQPNGDDGNHRHQEHEHEHEHEDDGDPPPPPAEPVTKPGDVWRLGRHRLLCGDAFDADDRARLLDGVLADVVVTDPPYAVYGSSTGVASDVADDKMVRPFFAQLGRILLESLPEYGHAYACCDWRSFAALWEGFRRGGLVPKNCLVWDKGGSGLGSNYANTHEFIAFFARLPRQAAMGNRPAGQRSVFRSNILRYPRPAGGERLHNAAKPVRLLAELISNSSDEGGRVLDLFAGSGSTLIAAEKTGRIAYAMEMEPGYCDVIVRRWEQLTGEKAVRE